GAGDLDLLVDPAAWSALVEVLLQLGFKRAVAPPWLQLPGVDSYLGCDPAGGPLVHVHAYHRIVIGLPWRTTYTVPLAETVLAGASAGSTPSGPAPRAGARGCWPGRARGGCGRSRARPRWARRRARSRPASRAPSAYPHPSKAKDSSRADGCSRSWAATARARR